ncbi:MAG: ABC transporter permease [Synergistaceae bacterium]|jgi:NitT/TauT family transport system permease protein|nr:ABC transporter permease [Synergistaceae bacterium]
MFAIEETEPAAAPFYIEEDPVFWKPQSGAWFALSVLSFVLALAVDLLLPFRQQVKPMSYRAFIGLLAVALLALYALSVRWPSLRKKLLHKSQFICVMGLLLAVWDLLSTKSGILPLPFFPGPVQIMQVMAEDWKMLFISSVYSLRLFTAGLLAGTALGIVTGVMIGWNRQCFYWMLPFIKVTGVIPAVAWIPIAMVVFPTSLIGGVFLIVVASWFPIAFMMAVGIASTPKAYYEVARTLGASERFLLFRIAIPNAMPSIFIGISTATSVSFATLVVSEMIGAKAGLGWYINWAKGWSAYSKVYAAIFIMAIAFSVILAAIDSVKGRILRWQKGLIN